MLSHCINFQFGNGNRVDSKRKKNAFQIRVCRQWFPSIEFFYLVFILHCSLVICFVILLAQLEGDQSQKPLVCSRVFFILFLTWHVDVVYLLWQDESNRLFPLWPFAKLFHLLYSPFTLFAHEHPTPQPLHTLRCVLSVFQKLSIIRVRCLLIFWCVSKNIEKKKRKRRHTRIVYDVIWPACVRVRAEDLWWPVDRESAWLGGLMRFSVMPSTFRRRGQTADVEARQY